MNQKDDTMYESSQKSFLHSETPKNEVKNQQTEDDSFMKRAIMLGSSILAGGAIGGGIAYAVSNNIPSPEDEVVKIIDESADKSFEEAFEDARAQLGPGALFRWHGGIYHTYTEEEWGNMSQQERDEFNQKIQPILSEEQTIENHETLASNNHASHVQPDTETEHVTKVVHEDNFSIASEEHRTINGVDVIVGHGTHNGHEVALIDIDKDGKYDYYVQDLNNDGSISENELVEVTDKNITVHDKTLINSPNIPAGDEYIIGEEGITEINGHQVIAAKAIHNGNKAVLIDADKDGKYDIAIEDSNNDGQIDEDDYHDIRSQAITVRDQGLINDPSGINANNVTGDEPDVIINAESETRESLNGSDVIAATGSVDGHKAVIVDMNTDGTYDVAYVDSNDNGTLDEGDSQINIVSSKTHVHNTSLINGEIASAESAEDNVPDYTNTLDVAEDNTEEFVVEVNVDENLATENTEATTTVEIEVDDNNYVAENNTSNEVSDTASEAYQDMAFNNNVEDSGIEPIDDYGDSI